MFLMYKYISGREIFLYILFFSILQKALAPEYTVDAMKRYLAEPSETVKREQQEKQKQIVRTFRESDFEDLMKRTEPKVI